MPGSLVDLPPTLTQAASAQSEDLLEDERERQARLDVRSGAFVILGGLLITFGTIIFPTEQGTWLFAWGPFAYGAFRLARGLQRKGKL